MAGNGCVTLMHSMFNYTAQVLYQQFSTICISLLRLAHVLYQHDIYNPLLGARPCTISAWYMQLITGRSPMYYISMIYATHYWALAHVLYQYDIFNPLLGARSVPVTFDARNMVLSIGCMHHCSAYRCKHGVEHWLHAPLLSIQVWLSYYPTNGNAVSL